MNPQGLLLFLPKNQGWGVVKGESLLISQISFEGIQETLPRRVLT